MTQQERDHIMLSHCCAVRPDYAIPPITNNPADVDIPTWETDGGFSPNEDGSK